MFARLWGTIQTFLSPKTLTSGWGIEYEQAHYVIANLKELRGADRNLPCPEHFRPVGIESDLSLEEFGDISVQSNTPDLVTSAKN